MEAQESTVVDQATGDNTPSQESTGQPEQKEGQAEGDQANQSNEGEAKVEGEVLSDEQIDAILNGLQINTDDDLNFTFKDDKKDEEGSKEPENPEKKEESNDTVLQELTAKADELTEKNTQLISELESERKAKEEALEVAKGVDEVITEITKNIPILDKYIDAIVSGESFELPPHYNEEKMARVYSHPIIGPLVKDLQDGKEMDVQSFVQALAEKRRGSIPDKAKRDVNSSGNEPKDIPLGGFGGIKPISII